MGRAADSPRSLHFAATLAFLLVVGLGTLAQAEAPFRGRAVLAALLLALGPALLWQTLTIALARALGGRYAKLSRALGLERFITREPEAPREPVVLVHALGIALVLWLALLAIGSWLLLLRLRSIESIELHDALAVTGVVGVALATLALAASSLGALRVALRALDRRVRLPLPASRALRRALWLGLPICAISGAGLLALAELLGPLAAPLWLGLAIGVQVALGSILPHRRGPTWLPRALAAAMLPLALLGAWGADRMLASSAALTLEVEKARPAGLLLTAARAATDFDGDGASSLFGERDCAAFTAARGPFAHDVPGNGVDENCDGQDDQPDSIPRAPTFYGRLRKKDTRHYDVLWVVIDAMRADHTSLLGYPRPTTPNLEALAKESVVFSRAYSQSSATMLSFPSMLTGLDPGRLSWVKESGRLQVEKEQRRYVSDMLAARGYQTGFITIDYFRDRLPGLLRGYQWVGFASSDNAVSSSSAAAHAATYIVKARENPAPMFLVMYLPAPHAPYHRHDLGYPDFTKDEISNYDLELVNADRHLGFVLDMLRSNSERWDKTIVIVTADHGEEFREHGETQHANNCHVESLHVPLLVRIPGQPAMRVDRPVGLVDLAPTLLELTGARTEAPSTLDGTSLLFHLHAPKRVSAERPLFCSVVNQKSSQGDFARRSVQWGKWKLMTELRGSKSARLFDIEADPGEQAPLELKGEAEQIAVRLNGWLRAQLTGNVHLIDMSKE